MPTNHGIYTDTSWSVPSKFTNTDGTIPNLGGFAYVADVMLGDAVVFRFKSAGGGATDGTIGLTNAATGQLDFAATPAQHVNVGAGLYRVHLKRDLADDLWQAEGQLLVGKPGAAETYLQFEAATASGTTVLSTSLYQRTITVDDYLAAGDGVTDDYTAITAAIAAAATAKIGYVDFLAKTYMTTQPIQLVRGVRLRGVGSGLAPISTEITDADFLALARTRIKAKTGFPSNAPVIKASATPNGLYALDATGLQDIMVDCSQIAARGIDLVSAKNCRFAGLLIYRPTSIGILETTLPPATTTGTAVAGGASTITLQANSHAVIDDYYNGLVITLTGGTGSGDVRTISGYVGSTGVATVSVAWTTVPDATTTYSIAGTAVTKSNNATYDNSWRDILIWISDGSAAVGWSQQGSGVHNVNRSRYDNIHFIMGTGDAIDIWNADTNVWSGLKSDHKGTGYGLRLRGNESAALQSARDNTFIGVQFNNILGFGGGGIIAKGGTFPSNRNQVFGHSVGNTSPLPVIESGAVFSYSHDGGVGVIAPGWRTLARSSVAIPHTGTTSETGLASVAVPANAMGPNGSLRIVTTWSVTNSANTKTLLVRFNSTTANGYMSVALTASASYKNIAEISNRGAANSQVGAVVSGSGYGTSTGTVQTTAVDTTAATTVYIRATLALGTETITLEGYSVEVIYGA